ncbi:MAG: hypothetical protein CMB80_16325 [Flammeovirgaceae bacterium]|nr:hypothetical protein [Flammeovirgaceae bacterium]HCX22206.1 hypothetical protein [Cytophagales bacterium]|tara:strand:+ start:9065 stop:9886 length:822 start_codon:yes stop_codon:yes gene_type:complete
MYRNFLTLLFLITLFTSLAQSNDGVGIGTTQVASDAIFEVESDNKGVLIPRLTTEQRESVTKVTPGLIVYDSEINSFFYYDGDDWIRLIASPALLDLDLSNGSIINLKDGVSPQDAVTKSQLDTKLNLSGGTLSGSLNMNSNKVTNLGNAVANTDALNLGQLTSALDERLKGVNVEKYAWSGSGTLRIPLYSVGIFDMNDLTNTGIHFIRNAFPYNSPYSGEDHMVFVQEVEGWGKSGALIYQVAIQLTGTNRGNINMRTNTSGGWSAWELIN